MTDVTLSDPAHERRSRDMWLENAFFGIAKNAIFTIDENSTSDLGLVERIAEHFRRRGGTLRVLVASDALARTSVARTVSSLSGHGVRPRAAAGVTGRRLVIDGAVGFVDGRAIRRPVEVATLSRCLDDQWARGTPVEPCPSEQRPAQALNLLAQGLTDAAVARSLGVSVRTVRADVARMMSTMAAESRFQAGVRAAQMGLV